MKNFLLTICYIVNITYAIGQIQGNNARILYQENKECYFFNLSNNNQTLYFDSVIYDNNRPISILVENDLEDTVFFKIKRLQSDKQKFTEKSTRYLLPKEHYVITLEFNSNRFNKQSILNSFFECYYNSSSNITDQHFILRLVGNIKLGDLPDFEESRFADLDIPIAKQTAPSYLNELVIRAEEDNIDEAMNANLSLDDSDSIEGLFYYYTQNKREFIEPIDSFGIYKYHIYLKDLSEIGLNQELLKSYLKSNGIKVTISKPPNHVITSEQNDFLVFYCKSEDIERIKILLKGVDIHFIIDSKHYRNNRFLDDTYDLYFSSNLNWNEDDVGAFLNDNGIKNYKGIRKTNNEFSMKYSYFVEFTLDNKYQHSEQNLINKLIDMPEVAWISSGRKTYVKKD
ncbi:MAG: hypothetical protein MK105_15850 [Crocinitomicaceae bacterium]|nr:hypothetical protein [Crocinitomicaceae bacterium]